MSEQMKSNQEQQYPARKKLQGKLLDYLMNLARKNIAGEDMQKIIKFDPEVSNAFLEFVKTHPENTKFPSDEVYFYLLEVYENDDSDIYGLDFLMTETQQHHLNERLIKIYEQEKEDFYKQNPQLLEYKQDQEQVHIRAEKLRSVLQSKMLEKVKLPDFDLSDLL